MIRYTMDAIFVCLCLVGFAQGQEDPIVGEQPKDLANTHDAIRVMRDGLLKAIDNKDVDSLLEFLHEDVVMTAQAGAELKAIRKHQGIREYMESLLTGTNPGVKSLKLNIEVDELTILHGDDAGIAFGTSNDHYVLRNDSEFNLATRWSATLVKDGEQWKIASLQLSSNLFDNPVLDAAKKSLYVVGTIATAIGLSLGLLSAKLIRSKRSRS